MNSVSQVHSSPTTAMAKFGDAFGLGFYIYLAQTCPSKCRVGGPVPGRPSMIVAHGQPMVEPTRFSAQASVVVELSLIQYSLCSLSFTCYAWDSCCASPRVKTHENKTHEWRRTLGMWRHYY